MSKHTPGPWSTQVNVVNYRSGRRALEVRDAADDLIATMPGRACDKDNARLIAAAPDLLRELKKARAEFGECHKSFVETATNPITKMLSDPQDVLEAESRQDLLNSIDAAIEKAEAV